MKLKDHIQPIVDGLKFYTKRGNFGNYYSGGGIIGQSLPVMEKQHPEQFACGWDYIGIKASESLENHTPALIEAAQAVLDAVERENTGEGYCIICDYTGEHSDSCEWQAYLKIAGGE